jgi:thioredoxin
MITPQTEMKAMMKTSLRFVVFCAMAVGAVAINQGWCANESGNSGKPAVQASTPTNATQTTVPTSPRPKLLDLGATKCIPCKMMAPVLEKLKKDYAGRLEVEFIDVWQNPDAGKQHKIELIPTQIFYSDSGKELFRHVGFYGREDILAKWKELGVDLNRKPGSTDSAKPTASSGSDNTKHD